MMTSGKFLNSSPGYQGVAANWCVPCSGLYAEGPRTLLKDLPLRTFPPQLPFQIRCIPTNRDHKALNRGTLGGLGSRTSSRVCECAVCCLLVASLMSSDVALIGAFWSLLPIVFSEGYEFWQGKSLALVPSCTWSFRVALQRVPATWNMDAWPLWETGF